MQRVLLPHEYLCRLSLLATHLGVSSKIKIMPPGSKGLICNNIPYCIMINIEKAFRKALKLDFPLLFGSIQHLHFLCTPKSVADSERTVSQFFHFAKNYFDGNLKIDS